MRGFGVEMGPSYDLPKGWNPTNTLNYNTNLTLEEAGLTGDRPSSGPLDYNANLNWREAGLTPPPTPRPFVPAVTSAIKRLDPTMLLGLGLLGLAAVLVLKKPTRAFAGRRRRSRR
jgi:hypothetical protein